MSDTRKITVRVTQEHIDRGIPYDSCACPIAISLHEMAENGKLGLHAWSWIVDQGYVFFSHIHDVNNASRLPNIADEFISAFDSGRPVNPIEFELEVPA